VYLNRSLLCLLFTTLATRNGSHDGNKRATLVGMHPSAVRATSIDIMSRNKNSLLETHVRRKLKLITFVRKRALCFLTYPTHLLQHAKVVRQENLRRCSRQLFRKCNLFLELIRLFRRYRSLTGSLGCFVKGFEELRFHNVSNF